MTAGNWLDRVHVTDHALERWRSRTGHAVATVADVARAAKASRQVGRDEETPFLRKAKTSYLYHRDSGCYFVLESLSRSACRVVTVLPARGG